MVPHDQSLDIQSADQSQVLVLEQSESIYVGLYLSPDLHQKVHQQAERWSLTEYCEVVEEVSHFVYLTWSAAQEQTVTQMDLELQAEVDKFLLLSLPKSPSPWLTQVLFEKVTYRKDLDAQQRDRYQHANRLAYKFAKRLQAMKQSQWLSCVRSFYRQSSHRRRAVLEHAWEI